MSNTEYLRARVDEARQAAATATLANVRDRCLRAAAVWEDMAARAARMDEHRLEEARRRAVRDGAALAAPIGRPRRHRP